MSEDPEFDPEDFMPDQEELCIEFIATIAELAGAITRSGKSEGGGRITYDVPESELGALAAHMPLAQSLLRVKVTLAAPEETANYLRPKRQSNRPSWVRDNEE